MKKKVFWLLILTVLFNTLVFAQAPTGDKWHGQRQPYFKGPQWRIPGFFDYPIQTNYYYVKPKSLDAHNASCFWHCWGSYGLNLSLYYIFNKKPYLTRNNAPLLWSSGLTFALGIIKEIEDGFRDGFSNHDVYENSKGIALSCLSIGLTNLVVKKINHQPLVYQPPHQPSPTAASELEKQLYSLFQRAEDVFQEALREAENYSNPEFLDNQKITFPDSVNDIAFIYQMASNPSYLIRKNKTSYFIDLKPLRLTFYTSTDTLSFSGTKFMVNSALTNKKLALSTNSPQNFNECLGLIFQCRAQIDDFQKKIAILKEKRQLQLVKNIL